MYNICHVTISLPLTSMLLNTETSKPLMYSHPGMPGDPAVICQFPSMEKYYHVRIELTKYLFNLEVMHIHRTAGQAAHQLSRKHLRKLYTKFLRIANHSWCNILAMLPPITIVCLEHRIILFYK
jgi:hypothetical protein